MPLTSYPGFETVPSFSPDGNQVAFSWNGEKGDNYDIYVKLIGSGRTLRLTTDPAADRTPAWSPDGRSIAFRRTEANEDVTIYLVPALGGPEREIARLGKTSFMFIGGWSPDGRRLLVSWKDRADEPSRLFWVSVDNGETHRLTSPPPTTQGDWWGRISPDGRTIAFVRVRTTAGFTRQTGDLYTLPLSPEFLPKLESPNVSHSTTRPSGKWRLPATAGRSCFRPPAAARWLCGDYPSPAWKNQRVWKQLKTPFIP